MALKKIHSNEELIRACIKGNQRACKQLYDTYSGTMMGVCLRYMGNRDEAQDVLQEGMIKVFDKLHTLRNPEDIGGWIRRIMITTAINYIQRKRTNWSQIDDVENELPPIEWNSYEVEPLLLAIQQLPDKYRMVFNMHEVEGYENEEIANQLNLQQSSVRSILFRARKMIQDNILKNDR